MKFSIKDLFSKFSKYLMENFIFCAVYEDTYNQCL